MLAGSLDAEFEAKLEQNADLARVPARDEAALRHAVAQGCDAIVARTYTPLTARVFDAAAPSLRVVGIAGVGLDAIDLTAAASHGVRVLHTPAASSDAVAELTIALLLNLLRRIPSLTADYARGAYHDARAHPHGPELRELRVGIIGMGRIGSRVGRLAAGFGAAVAYNDISDVGPFDFPATPQEKTELFAACDVVTLHTPLTPDTRRMVTADTLATFKHGAYLLNTARGPLVDLAAVSAALAIGRLAGAGLDVTDPEPLPPAHPLFSQPACLLTPHIAARTYGAVRRMFAIADDVLAALAEPAR